MFDELGGFDLEKRKQRENFQLRTICDKLNFSKQKFQSSDSGHCLDII